MYPLRLESELDDFFQLTVTNFDAIVIGKISMFSDCKERKISLKAGPKKSL